MDVEAIVETAIKTAKVAGQQIKTISIKYEAVGSKIRPIVSIELYKNPD